MLALTRCSSVRANLVAAALTLLSVACGSRPVDMLPVSAGVRMETDTTYYPVEGTDARAWRRSMAASAARAGVAVPYAAHTRWRIRWTYPATRTSGSGCELVTPSVSLDVHYTMPQLMPDSSGSAEDRAEWRRYLASLWTHETGHALRGVYAARAVRDELRQVRGSSCTLVAAEARRATELAVEKYRTSDREYDERSRHGALQGAIFASDPRRRLSIDSTYRDTVLRQP